MGPLARPALAHGVIDDRSGVADQVLAAPVVLQIIIAAEPSDMDKIAGRTHRRGAAHPGQHDIGTPRRDLAAEGGPGRDVEQAAEAQFGERHPGVLQSARAVGIGPDQDPLRLAGALQGIRETHEKDLGPAVARSRHRLQ